MSAAAIEPAAAAEGGEGDTEEEKEAGARKSVEAAEATESEEEETLQLALGLYDYVAANDDELSLRAGRHILVLSQVWYNP